LGVSGALAATNGLALFNDAGRSACCATEVVLTGPRDSPVKRARRTIIRAVNRHHGGRTANASTRPVRIARATGLATKD
jgi:hypothetical protein